MLPLVDCCLLKISYCRLGIAAVVTPCLLCVLWVDCWFWICFPLLLPLFPLASLHHGVVCCRHPSTAPLPPQIIVVSLHSKHRHCLMRCASALPMHCASALPKSTCPPAVAGWLLLLTLLHLSFIAAAASSQCTAQRRCWRWYSLHCYS